MSTPVITRSPESAITRRCMVAAGLACVAAGTALLALPASGADRFAAAVPTDVLEDYLKFLNGRDPLGVTDFTGAFTRRDVVEVVLLQQALHLGGWKQALELDPAPTTARVMREIELARAACSATSYWRETVASEKLDFFYFSDALADTAQFEAGLYTVATNQKAMAVNTLAGVQRLTAISNRDWVVDWRTLEQLGVLKIEHAGLWNGMVKMVAAGRADFVLAPFQATQDLSLVVDSVRMVPIPGLKIALRGTRSFLISRQHPRAAALRDGINAGLTLLRQKGLIRRAYEQCGFVNPRVAQWATLQPPSR